MDIARTEMIILTEDIEKMKDFYADKLGLEVTRYDGHVAAFANGIAKSIQIVAPFRLAWASRQVLRQLPKSASIRDLEGADGFSEFLRNLLRVQGGKHRGRPGNTVRIVCDKPRIELLNAAG